MLELENLSIEVGGKQILTNINLSVESGYTNVLFGPNGAGKSALLMSIMGFSGYKITNGKIYFKGEDITDLPLNERAERGLGIMGQRPPNMVGVKLKDLLEITAEECIDLDELVEELNMSSFLERDINVGFSGGEIKRSELLQLAAQAPSFYLLDEPESGVDLVNISQIGMMINKLLHGDIKCAGRRRKEGNSGLVITHTGQILDYIEADKGYILCNGQIMCSGNPRDLLNEIKTKGYQECVTCKIRQS
ncbi:ABC transporter ATP-binding protein [Methanosalsum natronophilum]|uniref:ABC transporter ATP-binding protein n=1 Tax=Methanosalsum natronophilum TaxID=768733 RepID=A0A424Z3P8_9EURY|nr:ABC transporter ATP-binding protein [Methanosalsum natronophilum]MCS3924866.1 Fe-S cluster assembly ATP-binding protein [Methanosalsum natronophilum]RQD90594.1 MAG: ABC transporter ATP-binding protein [Methanosalsum natronophilum]